MHHECFHVDALIREKKAEFLQSQGVTCVVRQLETGEYVTYLKKKLQEEACEAREAHTPEKTLSELIDVWDVLELLIKTLKITPEDFQKARQQKQQRGGTYDKMMCLCHITVPADSPLLEHYHAHPQRYIPAEAVD